MLLNFDFKSYSDNVRNIPRVSFFFQENGQVENEHDFSSEEVLNDGNDGSRESKQGFLRQRKQSYQVKFFFILYPL